MADRDDRMACGAARRASGVTARTAEPAPTSTGRCVAAVRQMILSGELLPGETIRPARLAGRLGMSRIPVREALTALQAEGVVTYTPRIGHAVARFSAAEFAQVYLMRRLLEAELLGSADLAAADLGFLEQRNAGLARLAGGPAGDGEWLLERKRLNREFHFHLLGLSPHRVILAETERLWNMSELYRSLYAYDPLSLERIVAEHAAIIDAVRDRSRTALLAAADRHRGSAEIAVLRRLGPQALSAARLDPADLNPEGGC
jgi:DNA-binding GntR family transcriptional regulator